MAVVPERGELVLQPAPAPPAPGHAPRAGHAPQRPVAAGRQQLVEGLAEVVGEECVQDGVHAAARGGVKRKKERMTGRARKSGTYAYVDQLLKLLVFFLDKVIDLNSNKDKSTNKDNKNRNKNTNKDMRYV